MARLMPTSPRHLPAATSKDSSQPQPAGVMSPTAKSFSPPGFSVICDDVAGNVTLTGDMDDDLNALEALEDKLGVHVSMTGISTNHERRTDVEASCSLYGNHSRFLGAETTSHQLLHAATCPENNRNSSNPGLASSMKFVSTYNIGHASEVDLKQKIDSFDSKWNVSNHLHESKDMSVFGVRSSQQFAYDKERNRRLVYQDENLHSLLILLLLSLTTSADGQFEKLYFCHEAAAHGAGQQYSDTDPCMVLYFHLNQLQSKTLMHSLVSGARALGHGAYRMLKLLAHALFPMHVYNGDRKHLARGTFSYVQRQQMMFGGNCQLHVAEKVGSTFNL